MKKCIDCNHLLPLAEYNSKRSDCRACQADRRLRPLDRFRDCRKHAHERSYAFRITPEEYDVCTRQPCYICGGYTKGRDHNGVDRVNNSIGYLFFNIAPCCWTCNRMKGSLSLGEFLEKVKKIYRYNNEDSQDSHHEERGRNLGTTKVLQTLYQS